MRIFPDVSVRPVGILKNVKDTQKEAIPIRNAEVKQGLPADGKRLLVINTLFAGASALSSTFLNIYFWKMLHGLAQIAVYNFFIFFCIGIGYVVAGLLAKRTDRLYMLRLGVAILALFYILILVLGSQAHEWYAVLGGIQGLGTGFYYLSLNVLVFEVTEPETRDQYNGANAFLLSSASVLAPLFAGKILSAIPERGYHLLFLLSFALFFASVFFTWRMNTRDGPALYNLYAGFRPEEHTALWRKTLTVSLSIGFREGVLAFLPFLLVFLVTKNEEFAGRYLMTTAICSLIATYFVKRFLIFERRVLFVTVASLMLALSVVGLLIQVNTVTLFLFGILNSLFSPLLLIPYACLTYDVMGKLPEAVHRKVEYIVIREGAVTIGRCLCLLLMIASEAWLTDRLSVRLAFLLVGTSPLVGLLFFRRSSASFRKTWGV